MDKKKAEIKMLTNQWWNMNPRISKAIPADDYKLKLVFTNGEEGIYDCSGLLNFGVFQER